MTDTGLELLSSKPLPNAEYPRTSSRRSRSWGPTSYTFSFFFSTGGVIVDATSSGSGRSSVESLSKVDDEMTLIPANHATRLARFVHLSIKYFEEMKSKIPLTPHSRGLSVKNLVFRSHEFPIDNIYSALRPCDGICSNRSRNSRPLQDTPVQEVCRLPSL